VSHYGFREQFSKILTKLYRIHISQTHIPLERQIINIVEEIPTPDVGTIVVQCELGNEIIKFQRPVDQNAPYVGRIEIEAMFHALDVD